MDYKKTFVAIIVAWIIFLLIPRVVGPPSQNSSTAEDDLMLIWRTAYISTCTSANATINTLFGENAAQLFCVCMADRYSAKMPRSEAVAMARSGTLPPRILSQREKLQDECLDEVVSKNAGNKEIGDSVLGGIYSMIEESINVDRHFNDKASESMLSAVVLNNASEVEYFFTPRR